MKKANERLVLASHVRKLSTHGQARAQAFITFLAFAETGKIPSVPGQHCLVTLWHVLIGAVESYRFNKTTA